MRAAPLVLLLLVPVSAWPAELEREAATAVGLLRFRVLEAATDTMTPARVTVIDERGRSHVAASAVPVAGECMDPSPEGWATAASGGLPGAALFDPAVGAKAFYVDGPVEMEVPAGRYRVTASKGFEFEQRSLAIEVTAESRAEVPIRLERWANMSLEGWFSADGHLHIARPSPELDPLVATWMAAEDLQVANLLQMGRAGEIVAARQYAFGEEGRYRQGPVVLAPGQENPRTWVLGHGVVLGASDYLDPGEAYLVYQPVWRRAQMEGALSGYAHWNPPGALIDAPTGLVDFLEVLQFDHPNYEMLYRLWGLGLLATPVAGTDFPCIGDLPGAARFYARVTGPFSWEGWLEAVRRGRTFVTNGPLLELEVEGHGIGDRLRLDEPGRVRVDAVVRFDPTRDDVRALELVHDGEVVFRATEARTLGRISFSTQVPVLESGWLALRSTGVKLDRRPHADRPRESAAHTGPIVVRVAGTPPLGTGAAARRLAREARDEAGDLRRLFASAGERAFLEGPKWLRGVEEETLRLSRPGLLAEVGVAEAWYGSRAGAPAAEGSGPTGLGASGEFQGFRTSSRTPGAVSRPPP